MEKGKEGVRMAKEIGLNPRSLIKNTPSPHERWKLPVGRWIRSINAKRFLEKRDVESRPAAAHMRHVERFISAHMLSVKGVSDMRPASMSLMPCSYASFRSLALMRASVLNALLSLVNAAAMPAKSQ